MPHVLAVDDSLVMRRLVALTLEAAGFDVTEPPDGRDALEKAQAGGFHLIVTDINMPGMDGIQPVRELRCHPRTQFIPILMLTTVNSSDKVAEAKLAGATGWVVKPFEPEEQLRASVRRLIPPK